MAEKDLSGNSNKKEEEKIMLSRLRNNDAKGFTLIELLIVILIISIFYFLVSASFKRDKKERQTILKIENIREYPLKDLPKNGAELICINSCKNCFVYNLDNFKESQIKSDLSKLEVYIPSRNGDSQRAKFGRYRDSKVCLRFRYYPNGSTDTMIIHTKDRYYYIPSYFGKIESFDSLSDASDKYSQIRGKFTDKGDYY